MSEYAWKPQDCIGLLGRIFGHKFTKAGWRGNGCCYRCGMPEGDR